MTFLNILKTFRDDEDGAVTVDWVVLTAGCVGLAAVIGTTVAGGLNGAATTISTELGADGAVAAFTAGE